MRACCRGTCCTQWSRHLWIRMREVYSDDWAFSGRLAAQCLDQGRLGGRSGSSAAGGVDGHHGDVLGLPVLANRSLGQRGSAPRSEVWIPSKRFAKQWGICSGPSNATRTLAGPRGITAGANLRAEHEILTNGTPSTRKKYLSYFARAWLNWSPSWLRSRAENASAINGIASQDAEKFRFGCELWCGALYEFAASYHTRSQPGSRRASLVCRLPGRLYSYLLQHAHSSAKKMEADSDSFAWSLSAQKPVLIEKVEGEKLR